MKHLRIAPSSPNKTPELCNKSSTNSLNYYSLKVTPNPITVPTLPPQTTSMIPMKETQILYVAYLALFGLGPTKTLSSMDFSKSSKTTLSQD